MQRNGMSTAALIFGIASLILSFFFGIGFFLGFLGLAFALLSRRPRMNTSARIGVILSIAGSAISLIMIVSLVALANSAYLKEYMEDSNLYDPDEYYEYSLPDEGYDYYDGFDNYFGFGNDYYDNFGFGNEGSYNEGGRKL